MDAARRLGDTPRIAAALVDALADDQLALRVDAAAWLAAAGLYVDRFAEADVHANRGLTLGRASGQGEILLVLYQVLGSVWCVRGKLAQATELLDGAIETARLLGKTEELTWSLYNQSAVALAVGDMDTALASAQESIELTRDAGEDFAAAWAAVRLAGALLETGEPAQAVELLLGFAGGEELTLIPGGWRAYCLELLTRCWPALDCRGDAERAAACAEAAAATVRLPLAAAWANRAAAAVALDTGNATFAAERALASAADNVGMPIEAVLSRTLAGRALAQAGDRERAVAHLDRAAAELDACGAAPPRSGGAGAGKARPPHAPAHPARQSPAQPGSSPSPNTNCGWHGWSSTAKPTPRSPRSCSSARRLSRRTCTTASARPRLIARRAGTRHRARRPNGRHPRAAVTAAANSAPPERGGRSGAR